MKAKIFSFLTLLVGLTVTTACTDAEDWEHGMNTVFPESVPMGYYHTDSRTFSGLYDYGVVLTKNAAGDQVYYLILEGRKGTAEEGNVYTAFDATDIKYDQKSGVMTVTEPQSFYDGLATSNLIYNYENPDLENLLMQVSYVGDNKETKSVRQVTNGYPNVVAKWKGQSESGKKLELELLAADETGKLVAEATLDGTALTNGTYAYSGATTTVTTAEKTFTISYNEIYQYVVTVDGESFVLDRVVNDPIPETYTEYAAGIVVYNTAYYGTDFAGPFKGESTESILYKSDKFSNKYLLAPYGMNNNGIQIFAHEEGGKTIYTVTNQYVAPLQGGEDLLVTDAKTSGLAQYVPDQDGFKWDLDGGEVNFYLFYHVGPYQNIYGMGIYKDQFVITEVFSGEKQETGKDWSVLNAKKSPIRSFVTEAKLQSFKR